MGSVALVALIVHALFVMVRAVKVADVPLHIGPILGIVILLIPLPTVT